MNIAIKDIYDGFYANDRLFDVENCPLGKNLLMPSILLKKGLKKNNHELHTSDMYKSKEIDVIIFQDIPKSILTIDSLKELVTYFLRGRYKNDYLFSLNKRLSKDKKILIITEPPVVWPKSYKNKYYKYFGTILTWDDDLVEKYGFQKYYIPQYYDGKVYDVSFENKRLLTCINSNNKSNYKNELYSERLNTIKYCQENGIEFDLYGRGWDKDTKCYKGAIDNKLDTLSQYKFSICYENIRGLKGYITEKIFDCFFSNCVPIYWGAENIEEFIPSNTFIDRRRFKSNKELIEYISNISEQEYNKYIKAINKYLNSDQFKNTFDSSHYVDQISKLVIEVGNK